MKKILLDGWSRFYSWFGLWVLNSCAFFGDFRLERDIGLGSDDRQRLDYYATGKACRGIVFFIYGGNWMEGSKQNYRFLAKTLCSEGFDVVIPDYRLYPKVRFNEIIQDVVRAMAWLQARNTLNKPIFVMGHSAGAQMGALACLDRELAARHGVDHRLISGFIGLAGPYDFYPFTEKAHYDLFAPEADYPKSQPVNYTSNPSVPMLLLHGKEDQRVRRGHSKSLMEKMRDAGGSAERVVYENMGHVEIVIAFSRLLPQRWPVLQDVCKFINRIITAQTSVADGMSASRAPGFDAPQTVSQTYS